MTPVKSRKRTAARPGRRVGAQRTADIRNQLLDVSEALFAQRGFHGVTLKQIAQRAKVTTALLHYYFADKDGLLVCIFNRRAEEVNQMRLQALDDYEKRAGGHMTLEGVLEAFIRPVYKIAIDGGANWRNYSVVTAQLHCTPGWGAEIVSKYIDPILQRCVTCLSEIYPKAAKEDLYWCFLQLSGAVVLSLARTGRIDRWSGGACRSDDLQTACSQTIAYAIAGFRAACERPGVTR